MGFRFRKRIKIAPGINLNIGKKGITSATIGKRGASFNIGGKGTKATLGIPGTGLSWTSSLSSAQAGKGSVSKDAFRGLVIHSSEFMKAPYRARRGWSQGGGKIHYGWKYKFAHLALWFIAAFLFEKHLPGLSLLLVIIGVIRFFWKQPEVNFSIKEYLDTYC